MTLTVWARTPDLRRRGQLVALAGSKAVLRDTDVGTWALTVDGASATARAFTKGWGVQVFEDGRFLFSGDADELSWTFSGGDAGSSATLELSGTTDVHVLEDRLVYPNRDKAASAQTSAYYTVRGMPAEDLIAQLINHQAGTGALPSRATRGLAEVVSSHRGTASSVNARFSNLLDEVRAIAQTSGLVVDVQHRGLAAALDVVVRERKDRSRAVRFRPGKGVAKATAGFKAPTSNAVLVAGGGQGAARVIKEHVASASEWAGRRVEVFKDRRDTTEADELEKAGAETLQEGAGSAYATFEVQDSEFARFGEHFWLGDTVTLDLGEFRVSEPVRVVELSWDEYGRTASKLTIGDPAAEDEDTTPATDQRVRAMARALADLSARL